MVKSKGKILIVDDNEEVLIALKMFLSKHFEIVDTEKNPNKINSILENKRYDIFLLDMNFSAGISSGNEGIYWMRSILELDPAAIIVFITAYGDIELAVKAIKEGATDFIQKPWNNKKVLATLLTASKLRRSNIEITSLKNKQKHLSENISKYYKMFIGTSKSMQDLFRVIAKVAVTDANVLILGENGTGKELVAREIHKQSKRASEVFINVDLGSLSESLFESELFGHVKGAYTDAKTNKTGRFEIASGGTLFLDEIANIPLSLQSKLLAVLQNRLIIPLGSNISVPVDIRLISATNRNLIEMVNSGSFREDLLYRINTILIEIPPLRERQDDILRLTEFFLERYKNKYGRSGLKLNKYAMDKLTDYYWPGNVRELEHVVEKAVILSDKDILGHEDFFFQQGKKAKTVTPKTYDIDENEKILISDALREFRGNMAGTARELGITRATLYRKIKKYEI